MEKIRDLFADGLKSVKAKRNTTMDCIRDWFAIFFCGLLMLTIAVVALPALIVGIITRLFKRHAPTAAPQP